MIKNNRYQPTWQKREPWRFIPRRDLFPDAIVPTDTRPTQSSIQPTAQTTKTQPKELERKYNTPVHQLQNKTKLPVGQQSGITPKKQKGSPLPQSRPLTPVRSKRKQSTIQPEFLFVLFIGWLLFESTGSKFKDIKGLDILDNPQNVQMLKSIGPYLDDREQEAIYTAAGVMEAIYLIRDVMNHTYHNQHRATVMRVPSNPTARKVEAIKAIKPYMNPNNRKQLDQALILYEGADKLQKNIAIYQNNRALSKDKKTSPIEFAGDILKVISPILPYQHRQHAEKVMQVMKMMEVIGTVDKLKPAHSSKKSGTPKIERSALGSAEEADQVNQQEDHANQTEQTAQVQKIMDSLTPMMNEEQKESMDMIMKMAQLLSQSEQKDD